MKRVLIIAYDFPPLPSIGGLRPFSWHKHFVKQGVYPIIITRKWNSNIKNIDDYYFNDIPGVVKEETKESLIIKIPKSSSSLDRLKIFLSRNKLIIFRKIITFIELIFKWKFSFLDDKAFLYRYAKKYLDENKVDFIIASGEPFILFKYANKLSKKYNIPWVADYRDGWTTNHVVYYSLDRKLLKPLEKYYEKKFLRRASYFMSVSKMLIWNIQSVIKKNGFLIENGVDLETLKKATPHKETQNYFSIVYTGSIYTRHNVDLFIDSFLEFSKSKTKVKLILIGVTLRPSVHLERLLDLEEKYPELIEIKGVISNEKALSYQKASSVLLKFNLAPQNQGYFGAKLYEYAAAKKPILTIPSYSDTSTSFFPGRDIQVFGTNKEEIIYHLETYYAKFLKGEEILTSITEEEVYRITREYHSEMLATIFKTHFK